METVEGTSQPYGFSIRDNLANFSLFSSHANRVFLGFFQNDQLLKEIPMIRSGNIWHIGIVNLPKNLQYAYRCEGPKEHFYCPDKWLIDPYAKKIHSKKAVAAEIPPFDWENDAFPRIPKENLVLYEMHVRGFTKHPSSNVSRKGTYLGILEKIPHLKKLGVNAIELMPIFGFDPNYLRNKDQLGEKKLVNYWGYNPLHFFFPMDWYADEDPIFEFKTLIRELHKAGIEVLLDVVYNHTGEEDDLDYYVHFRGIDNCVYYLMSSEGKYVNYSGCWNTVNTNHPVAQQLILDSLRYWVDEMHVDGFRFDLASILTRDTMGCPLAHPPILEAIAKDPILKKTKLIAEAWDATGLYQLGAFPKWGPWSEWNGCYRDVVRKFLKGDQHQAGAFASVICGSEMIYHSSKTPLSSINFITAHDGYSLSDLVSYEKKYNQENGENNRDGSNVNESWNCGVEGPTEDLNVLELRQRQMRNFLLTLFISQGIPMLLMGDEYGHTRHGNNNPYVQDNEINWFLWDQIDEKRIDFISSLSAFRKEHPSLHQTRFLVDADVKWFTDWGPASKLVVYQLKGPPSLCVAFNANSHPISLTLPQTKGSWHTVVNTADDWLIQKRGSPISCLELLPFSAFLAIEKTG